MHPPRSRRRRALLLTTLLPLSAAQAGMVAFFDVPDSRKQCPAGWQEYAPAKGRLILGTTEPGRVGQVTGKPMADRTPPLHRHPFTAGVTLPHEPVVALGGPNQTLTASGNRRTTTYATQGSDGNLPYMQLLACEQRDGFPASQAMPREMVAFFADAACPADWEPYPKLNGRFAVPLPPDAQSGDFNAAIGEPGAALNHLHKLIVSGETAAEKVYLPLTDASVALAKSWWPFAQNTSYGAKRFPDEEQNTDAGGDDAVPRVALLACIRAAGRPRSSELPEDMLGFMTAEDCPKHWRQKPASMGRYLVGMPDGPYAQSGIPFGGNPLHSKEQRLHTHEVRATLDLPSHGIAGANGCCAGGYAAAGSYALQGHVVRAANNLPYVQMRHCIVTPAARHVSGADTHQ